MLKKLIAKQQKLMQTAKAENREFTEAEQREFNYLQGLIDEEKENRSAGGGNGAEGGEGGSSTPGNGNGEGGGTSSGTPTGNPEGGRSYTPEQATEITKMCRHFNVDPSDYMGRGMSVEDVRRELMTNMMNENQPISSRTQVTVDEGDKFRDAVSDGLLLREGVNVANPAEGSNEFRSLSIREIAIECMEREAPGEDYRHMNADKLLSLRGFYNPTAAFPAILDSVVQKSYIEGLKKNKAQYEKFVKFGSLSNFKKSTNHEYLMSLGGDLAPVPENGELKAYTPLDVKMPERQLRTYGRQFTMTREAFINDDIGLLVSMPQRYAALSANTQNKLVYQILLGNKKIHDGKPLFDTSRGNTLKTGTDATIKSIQTMIYLLGMQKDATGDPLQLTPDLFIVPLGMGATLKSILYSPTIHTPDNTQATNPYAHMDFTVVEDVTLNSMVKEGEAIPWFMGVKGETIQIDYLNGQKEANIRRSEKPGTLGFVWDVYHDFAVSVLHPESMIRNPGIVIDMSES